jgi:hypothetical protein
MFGNSHNAPEKALQINLEGGWFGTFAEIGAGQEVARWFFHVGRASSTVAKSISAYDTALSNALYGATDHYVSRARLEAMLDHEFAELLQLGAQSANRRLFIFADTVARTARFVLLGGTAGSVFAFKTGRGQILRKSLCTLKCWMLSAQGSRRQSACWALTYSMAPSTILTNPRF